MLSSFLGLQGPKHEPDRARVVILPVPYDATTSFHPGARHAPEAVLRASLHIEEYDEEIGGVPAEVGIYTADAVEPDLASPESMVRRIQARVGELIQPDKLVITVGGDHTVAVGAGLAHAARNPGLSILQIDAHADMREEYEGSRFSHACAARRLSEADAVSSIVQVGIRSFSAEEAAYLEASGRSPILAHEIAERGAGWMIDRVLDQLGDPVYVTFDVDGLDPSVMPATGTPEPGGLGYYDALRLLRRVAAARRVVGADICELLPLPGLHACDVLVARLLYKMVGYFAPS